MIIFFNDYGNVLSVYFLEPTGIEMYFICSVNSR